MTLTASPADLAAVTVALGRTPAGAFRVVVRRVDGAPVVIENEPHLRDGTPMPTLYWLVDRALIEAVSRVESTGGVKRLAATVDPDDLARAHAHYATMRDRRITRHDAPRPVGGVGGTAVGVKCLHAHLAHYLAGGDDPVGRAVALEVELPPLTVEAEN